jgi:protein involved in ribonucleotide reduction
MKVFACETEVVLKIENAKAKITAIEIRYDYVHYEITYFDGSERKKVWVQECEFITNDKKKIIGFK